MTLPPHLRALLRLKRARVDFLMVGAMALNNFAPEISSTYSTGDCDILLRPTLTNLRRALRELGAADYRLWVNDEPLIRPDALILRRLLEARVTVRAEKEGGLPIDLLVAAKGFAFADWWKHRVRFKAGNAFIPCASLDQILESKRQAGREKDRVLLALYESANRRSVPRGRLKRAET